MACDRMGVAAAGVQRSCALTSCADCKITPTLKYPAPLGVSAEGPVVHVQ